MRARLPLRPDPHPGGERSAGAHRAGDPRRSRDQRSPRASDGRLAPGTRAARHRGRLVAIAATIVVAIAAAGVAHGFREVLTLVAGWIASEATQAAAVRTLGPWLATVVVASGVGLAAWIDRRVRRAHAGRLGLHVLAASVRDEHAPEPSLAGTVGRSGATLVATASFASLGREAPILELGGALGDATGRRTGASRPHLAVAGIAAAFAVAYHAPLSAVLYVGEHLRLRRDRPSMVAAIAGALVGAVAARAWFGSHPVFPGGTAPSMGTAALVAIGILPAWAASRLFACIRERATDPARVRRRPMPMIGAAVAVTALVVALAPDTAGNGMEALRLAHEHPTLQLALVLLIGKLVATTTALATGAPGGVLSPSLAVAAGAAMATWSGLDALGVALPGDRWTALLAVMVVGVAVGVHTPVVATVLLAEMSSDARVVPLALLVVAGTIGLERAWRFVRPAVRPAVRSAHEPVRDEDA